MGVENVKVKNVQVRNNKLVARHTTFYFLILGLMLISRTVLIFLKKYKKKNIVNKLNIFNFDFITITRYMLSLSIKKGFLFT